MSTDTDNDFTDDTIGTALADLPPVDPPKPPTTATTAKKAPAKKAPARKRAAAKKPDGPPPKMGRPSNTDRLQRRLEDQLMAIGLGLGGIGTATGNQALGLDGVAVMDHAEPIAKALAEVAAGNPKVYKFLDASASGSSWIGVAVAVGGLARQITVNHSTPPAELPDTATPSPFGGLADSLNGR